jgi:hypothetical protein
MTHALVRPNAPDNPKRQIVPVLVVACLIYAASFYDLQTMAAKTKAQNLRAVMKAIRD